MRTMNIKIDGPFTGSYSLALVNREMALALDGLYPGRVGLAFDCHPSGPLIPDQAFLEQNPEVNRLYLCGLSMDRADVILYNSYPPDFPAVPGALCLTNAYGWEESLFPPEYVRGFNQNLSGLTLMSNYVLKTMQDNGVGLPMAAVGLGVDHLLRESPDPWPHSLGRGFRFLHVSSCFPRKGLDVLLSAYGRAFNASDDVTLVIKTFPNPHNNAPELVEAFRREPGPPGVILINEDLSNPRMLDIYQRCHCLVAPSRGEGFGLPMAEAMALNIPVITTGYGGQTDFCTRETAWLIDYSFDRAATHLSGFGSAWAEPDPDHLAKLMRKLFLAGPDQTLARTRAARDLVLARYTWKACATRLCEFMDLVRSRPAFKSRLKTGLVTSWNCRCGIAEYSRHLLPHLLHELEVTVMAPDFTERVSPDEPNVMRFWTRGDCPESIPKKAQDLGLSCVVINFHFSFFSLRSFERLLDNLKERNISCLIIFHAVKNQAGSLNRTARALAGADRLLVHSVKDLNHFRQAGLAENAALFPHGVYRLPEHPRPVHTMLPRSLRTRRLVASFGFLMPHKGVLELIHAFARLLPRHPDLGLLLLTSLYPKDEVLEYHQECLQAVKDLGLEERVYFNTDFLPLEESLGLLRKASLTVFPYQHSAESSSAAVRAGLGADRPVAVTPLPIFDDVRGAVHFLPGTDPVSLALGLDGLLSDQDVLHSMDQARRKWLDIHAWPGAGGRLRGLVRSLSINDSSSNSYQGHANKRDRQRTED